MRWPGRDEVDRAIREWAQTAASQDPRALRIGYFGSYARGDWGVGSDLDLVVVVASSEQPFERRGSGWYPKGVPVPVDVLVYTLDEWERLQETSPFARRAADEAIWVYVRAGSPGGQREQGS
ncbi:nucleotidyltransferase domain-containing protein [Carboxydochorda subterranea]|uniref:Nucleotidyltransferase domain-containing protein n=1 Tax=Carboxydichorda subterranea TaxID=3109565 RepID=A0ABZ1C2A4_9FIRM|nr:nucleotidyltransferase domain-containing protein [Limnochorda sp. L945t]WRP18978.1 nucleotidyltransferase domain-containing protein [Limnochorda sp. L945t]